MQQGNPILHGEMDCLQNAGRQSAKVYRRATIYTTLYKVTSREHKHYPCPVAPENMVDALDAGVGESCTGSITDGIVPTLSMLWGELLWAGRADHLDVIGSDDAASCRELLTAFGYAPDPLPSREQLEPFVWRDKKREGDRLHFVLPTAVGESTTRAIAFDEFAAAL